MRNAKPAVAEKVIVQTAQRRKGSSFRRAVLGGIFFVCICVLATITIGIVYASIRYFSQPISIIEVIFITLILFSNLLCASVVRALNVFIPDEVI